MRKFASVSLTLSFLALASVCQAESIALVEADNSSYVTNVYNNLLSTGDFSSITIINAETSTPTVAQLQAYSSVLVWSDGTFQDPTTLGNNLDSYLRGGGGVVVSFAANTINYDLQGAFASNNDFTIEPGLDTAGTHLTLGTVLVPGSPLLNGVTSFDGGSSSFYSSGGLNPGATDIANWSNGVPLIATMGVGGGTTVGLDFFPVSSTANSAFWVQSTDGTQIMANALMYAGGVQVAATPEPSTFLMLGTGLLGLGGVMRRRLAA